MRTSGAVRRQARSAGRIRAIRRDLAEGLRLAGGHRLLRALMFFGFVTSIGEGVVGTLFAPFIRHVLHGSSQAFGLFIAAQAIGGIAGGAIAVTIGQRISAARLFSYGAVAFGLIDLAIFLYPLGYVATWPAVIGIVLVGLPGALNMAGLLTLFQRGTADSYRGRVLGAFAAIQGLAVLAGTLAGGFLARPLGIIPVISVQGAGYLAAGLAMMLWLRDDVPGSRSVAEIKAVEAGTGQPPVPPFAEVHREIDVPS
jgi:MFS family permease